MPDRQNVIDGAVGFGVLLAVAAAIGVLIGGPIYLGYKAAHAGDPYFRDTRCVGAHKPKAVEITVAGITGGCVQTRQGEYRFFNHLSDYPVTLCIGRQGDCATGHYSPFPGRRITLQPGESRKIKFPLPSYYGIQVSRKYPVTVEPIEGLALPNMDIVVESLVPPSS